MATVTILEYPRPFYSWSKNPMILKLQTDELAPDITTRIQLSVDLFLFGTIDKVVELEEIPTADGIVTFDVSGIIDEYMEDRFTAPSAAAFGIELVANTPQQYGLFYRELASDGTLLSAGYLNDILSDDDPTFFFLALKGGLAVEALDYFNYWDDYFDSFLPYAPFLSWAPATRMVDKKQRIPLYYLNRNDDDDDLYLKLEIFNGTTSVATDTKGHYVAAGVHQVFLMYGGWEALDLQGTLDAITYTGAYTHYKVWLENSTTRVSTELTFIIDDLYHKNTSYLVYQNSVDGFDDALLTGEIERTGEYERQISSYNVISPSYAIGGIRKTYATQEHYGKKINTGYKQETEMDLLRELLLAPRIYEVTGDRWLAVELTEKTKSLFKSGDYLHGMPLEYRYQFKNRNFTPFNLSF